MHDIRFIRENTAAFKRGLARRGLDADLIFREIEQLDVERRENIALVQKWQEERNRKSKEIGLAKAAKDEARVARLMQEVSRLKSDIISAGAQVSDDVTGKLKDKLAQIPNLPLDEVPDGKDEHDNVEHHRFGAKRDYSFTPKEHFELGEALGQMDFETAAKLSGARFVVLKKGLARLERALGQFFLDIHTSEPHNYIEVAPPLMVRNETMFGTAQLPKFAEDQFSTVNQSEVEQVSDEFVTRSIKGTVGRLPKILDEIERETGKRVDPAHALRRLTDVIDADMPAYRQELNKSLSELLRLWLIPTAEVPLTNLVRESIVDEAQLPMRLTACTPCFRAEAGAAGKDTRGMIRQHQFTKVELVSITTPEQSKDEHERMLACAEEVLRRLELHYRVMTLCTGDMGFASQKTYDIEVWLPGQNMYREISSCSVCGEFQARRMNARYRPRRLIHGGALIGAAMPGRATLNQAPTHSPPRFVHTLNGSGVAVGRALIAVLENYQNADGSITVPEALLPYMGGMKKIEAN
jgi:seryl-tRNA synthetase